jgi:ribosomal protein S11
MSQSAWVSLRRAWSTTSYPRDVFSLKRSSPVSLDLYRSSRSLSTTARVEADTPSSSTSTFDQLKGILDNLDLGRSRDSRLDMAPKPNIWATSDMLVERMRKSGPHHLHVYSHRHNTHITLTKPNGESLISMSCGNVGFKKHQRGTYEAAFQLSSYILRAVQERGYLNPDTPNQIYQLDLIFRGYGDGRMAFQTALLGVEGRFIRNRITRVFDGTRLKIGGNRAPKPRRLG